MRRRKYLFFYLIAALFAGVLVWLVVKGGEIIQHQRSANGGILQAFYEKANVSSANPAQPAVVWQWLWHELLNAFKAPMAIFVLQILVIIACARLIGFLFSKINQPIVIGEILAGILLGPSLLGLVFPSAYHFLFPASSLPFLQFASQLGLLLFMFIIGMELDIKVLKTKANEVALISYSSILFPFVMGIALAYFLYARFAVAQASFLSFALFMGISLSITAFPVLARIIQERGLSRTLLGNVAITCAAANDIIAWCILASAIAFVKAGTVFNTLITLLITAGYVCFIILFVKPQLNKFGNVYSSKENLSKTIVSLVFIFLLASSFITEVLGVHTLFGAFIAGVAVPQNIKFKKNLTDKIEDVSLVLLLPLFFALTGLRTQVSLLGGSNWVVCLVVCLVAILAKFGSTTFSARYVGMSWRDSLSLGSLMNSRGLMELIVLNIGFDLGILSAEIFTMLVIMALVTTFMVSPVLDLINYIFVPRKPAQQNRSEFYNKVLISFAAPQMGTRLLTLASNLSDLTSKSTRVTALHVTPSAEVSPQSALLYEYQGFQPIKQAAQNLSIRLETHYVASNHVSKSIIKYCRKESYDLLLLGAARNPLSSSQTSGIISKLVDSAPVNLGILIDRNFEYANQVLIVIANEEDNFLLQYGESFVRRGTTQVDVLNVEQNCLYNLNTVDYGDFSLIQNEDQFFEKYFIENTVLSRYDLIIISLTAFNRSSSQRSSWMHDAPSILIMRQWS